MNIGHIHTHTHIHNMYVCMLVCAHVFCMSVFMYVYACIEVLPIVCNFMVLYHSVWILTILEKLCSLNG